MAPNTIFAIILPAIVLLIPKQELLPFGPFSVLPVASKESEPEHGYFDNQMKVEERPYSHAPRAYFKEWNRTRRLQRGTFNKFLYPKLREMHRSCDGQCFYAPARCVNDDGLRVPLNVFARKEEDLKHQYHCRLVASVAMHYEDLKDELYCPQFDKDNLRQTFCHKSEAQKKFRMKSKNRNKTDKFYTITLHRTFMNPTGENNNFSFYENGKEAFGTEVSSCAQTWDPDTGRKCKRTEFVAIAFLKNGYVDPPGNRSLHEDDLWYVCTADESGKSRVTMWSKITDAPNSTLFPQQIIGTKPHFESGMGVVFSKLYYNEDALSMGCQFVIQENNMTLFKAPNHTAYFQNDTHHWPITIKLGMGWVERDEKTGLIRRPFKTVGDKFNYYFVFKGSESFDPNDPKPPPPNGIAPTSKILFKELEVLVRDKSATISEDKKKDKENVKTMDEVLNKCQQRENFPDLYIACYAPNTQVNCIFSGRCAAVFIVEVPRNDKSFTHIKAHIYSNLPDHRSLRKVIRPKGFAAVGFSLDGAMGRDFVIACHANGMNKVKVYVSINYDKSNIYPGEISYDNLVYNTSGIGSAEKSRILCSWEMPTSFHVNLFSYFPIYRDVIPVGLSEKLNFNFRKYNYTLLLAAGNRNYPDGRLVYHDFRQALKEKFSKKLFFKKAGGVGRVKGKVLFVILITLLGVV